MAIPEGAVELGSKMIESYEGIGGQKGDRYFPYQGKADKEGVITIGKGRVLSLKEKKEGVIYIAGVPCKLSEGLTYAQVNQLFLETLHPRAIAIGELMPGANVHQSAAGLSKYYNNQSAIQKGTPGREFRKGNHKLAAAGMLLYVFSNGQPQHGLWRRCMSEALLMYNGEFYVAKDDQREAILLKRIKDLGLFDLAVPLADHKHKWLRPGG